MADRFTRGVLDGSIDSVESLKAAYREAAKGTHPDLSDGEGHEGFIALRRDYERALREFSRSESGQTDGEKSVDPGDPLVALDAFLKRGFPKTPRHRKESLRYRYARLRARSALAALDKRLPELFDAMERELAEGERSRPRAAAAVADLFASYVRAKKEAVPAALAAVRMETLRAFPPAALSPKEAVSLPTSGSAKDDEPGPAAAAFFRALPY